MADANHSREPSAQRIAELRRGAESGRPVTTRSGCVLFLLLVGCGGGRTADAPADASPAKKGVVHVVLFTHIEDASPGGMLGSPQSRMSYLGLRAKLVDMAKRAKAHRLTWVLQPDWKYLEAARAYEDATVTADTAGKNLFRYLRDDLQVAIDPHSHENGGYNYTDVAYLLAQLGVDGSTVIGGHIWDPSLPQFQAWDRFRAPVAGEHYPTARWRGDILIGAGTPNHVNDPLVSGVWRPKDRNNYFVDDPSGNIVSTGAWHNGVSGVQELVALYATGKVPATTMLTASWNIRPSDLLMNIDGVETSTLVPIEKMRDAGEIVVTDFTRLVALWRSEYGATGAFYRP